MPKYAIDSLTNHEISIEEWLLTRHNRGNPLCKVNTCRAIMTIVGEHNIDRATHFRHPAHSDCPSVLINAIPYHQLKEVPINEEQIEVIKELFLTNLHRVFRKCVDLVPNLSFREFYEIIEFANNLNIWGYVNIDIKYIPYILCTCKDIFRQRNPYRTYSFHFVFDDIKRVDELWINANNNASIIYRVNRNTQDVEVINIQFDLYDYENNSNLTQYYIDLITNIIN